MPSSPPATTFQRSFQIGQCQAVLSDNGFTISCQSDQLTQQMAKKVFQQEEAFTILKTCRETRVTPGGAVCSGGWDIRKVPIPKKE